MRIYQIKVIFLLLCLTTVAYAGVSGRVTDVRGNPIEGVNISTGDRLYNPTDSDGRFELQIDPLDEDMVTFTHVGFKPVMKKLDGVGHFDIVMQNSIYETEGVTVHASRIGAGNPARPYTTVTRDDIERDYTMTEFPLLLESTPNLYAYADAGGGMGYSYIKIRGFDDKRISVYVNGVPLNDPEDHATYFVDLPDFAAEVTDIQIERGIANSLYGDAAFGGSVNIVSSALDRERSVSLSSGYGNFLSDGESVGTMRKQALEFSSGLINSQWSFAGRYSKLYSDGYRENSWYDGWSYFFSLSRLDPNMTTTVNLYGGPMRMHLAYYGIDRETLETDRRNNPLTYDNETDNFNQPHYELHNTYHFSDKMSLTNTFYYIRGRGYYEQFMPGSWVGDYNLYNIPHIPVTDSEGDTIRMITSGDLTRQQWVLKNQYGYNPRLDIRHDNGEFFLGGAFYLFDSEHWGQVVWAEDVSSDMVTPQHRYYEYFGDKFSGSLFAGENYHLTDQWSISGQFQIRYIDYRFNQTQIGAFTGDNDFDLDWFFASPQVSVTFKPTDKLTLSTGVAISSRTPTDVAVYDANDPYAVPNLDVKPERVYNFELGGKYITDRVNLGVNLYWMELRNEIVPSGSVDDDGLAITVNAERSVHRGVELSAGYVPIRGLNLSGNLSMTYDRSKEFTVTQPLYDNPNDWYEVGTITVDYSDNPIAGFPDYIGNLMADYRYDRFRITGRGRFVGRQYIENSGNESVSIDPWMTFSASASVVLANPAGVGKLLISGRVDNIFNEEYLSAGFAESYYYRDADNSTTGYYIPASERSFYVELKLEVE